MGRSKIGRKKLTKSISPASPNNNIHNLTKRAYRTITDEILGLMKLLNTKINESTLLQSKRAKFFNLYFIISKPKHNNWVLIDNRFLNS